MSEIKAYQEAEDRVYSTVNEIDFSAEYNYSTYLRFAFEERLEIIKGQLYRMSPAPSRVHQTILGNLHLKIGQFLHKQPCKVFLAPFDVRFPKKSTADKDIFTVLQPDICIICDKSKLDDRGCIGAPDLVVEILSPGNNQKELVKKYDVYEEFGVKEYWVVSPSEQTLLIYTLNSVGKFFPSKLLTVGEKAYSNVLNGFELIIDELFED